MIILGSRYQNRLTLIKKKKEKKKDSSQIREVTATPKNNYKKRGEAGKTFTFSVHTVSIFNFLIFISLFCINSILS